MIWLITFLNWDFGAQKDQHNGHDDEDADDNDDDDGRCLQLS